MSASDGAEGVDASGPVTHGAGVGRERLIALLGDGSSSSVTPRHDEGPETDRGPRGLLARLGRVCAVVVSQIGVDGAGITVMGTLEGGLSGARDQLVSTGELARRLEDLQLTTGEGPCLDAYRRSRPVLVGDLAAEQARWTGFGPEALRLGAAALFSLPLQVGGVRLGTLDLHRTSPGMLSRGRLVDALTTASLATEILLDLAEQTGQADNGSDAGSDAGSGDGTGPVPPTGWLPDVHAEVHVAAGMLSARADEAVSTALVRLRAHAYAHGEPLHQVARRVIARDLVLDHDTSDGPPVPGPENEEP